MKLASLKGGRDGRLAVVSRDFTRMADAAAIAPTLQAALDRWGEVAPRLKALAAELDANLAAHKPFDAARCGAPLPRAYQWLDGSAYVNHVALVRRARGAVMPDSFWTDPLMYQGGSDSFLAPRDPIEVADTAFGVDLEAEVAVVTDDVPAGVTPEDARRHVKLLLLVNDVSLRDLIPGELAKGFGFVQSKPSSAFAPVAVTPDELGAAWDGGRLHGPILSWVNGAMLGRPDAGTDMTFDFPTLIAHAARTRPLCAGTIIGSGTVSNRDGEGGPGRPVAEGGVGYSCLAELRTVEAIRRGAPATPYLTHGDVVRIEMHDAQGRSVFGAIEQAVVPSGGGA